MIKADVQYDRGWDGLKGGKWVENSCHVITNDIQCMQGWVGLKGGNCVENISGMIKTDNTKLYIQCSIIPVHVKITM